MCWKMSLNELLLVWGLRTYAAPQYHWDSLSSWGAPETVSGLYPHVFPAKTPTVCLHGDAKWNENPNNQKLNSMVASLNMCDISGSVYSQCVTYICRCYKSSHWYSDTLAFTCLARFFSCHLSLWSGIILSVSCFGLLIVSCKYKRNLYIFQAHIYNYMI